MSNPIRAFAAAQPVQRRLVLFSDVELNALPDPEWQIDGLWQKSALAVLFGESGCGKSFLALDWACRIGTGRAWNAREVRATGDVVYVYSEGGLPNARKRLQAWKLANGLRVEEPANVYLLPTSLDLVAGDASDMDELASVVDEIGLRPALFVVDTLARNFGGADESNTAAMSAFVSHLDWLRERFDATVLAVHHTGHAKTRERGSSALKAAADTMMQLERADRRHALLNLVCTKQKDAEEFVPSALTLKAVEEAQSCVIEAVGAEAVRAVFASELTVAQRNALRALATFGDAGARNGEWQGKCGGTSSLHRWLSEVFRPGEYVEQEGAIYRLTDRGRLAAGVG